MEKGQLRKERVRLLFQLSRINLRISLISLLGLTIALSLVSSCLIYLDSSRAEYYLEMFEERSYDRPEEFSLWSEDINSLNQDFLLNIQSSLITVINEAELSQLLIPRAFSPSSILETDSFYLNKRHPESIFGITLDESVLDLCIEGSSLPNESNEILLFTPEINTSLKIRETFNLSILYFPDENFNTRDYYNFSLTISGLITPVSLMGNSSLQRGIGRLDFHEGSRILMDLDNFLTLSQSVSDTLSIITGYTYHLMSSSWFLFDYDLSILNSINVVKYINKLRTFWESYSWIEAAKELLDDPSDSIDLNHNTPYKYWLQSQIGKYNNLFSQFILLAVPVFLLTFLLVDFSLNLINEGRKKELVLFKMRGVSRFFIFSTLILETIAGGFLASILGLIVGMLLTQLIATTSGYLIFDITKLPVNINITPYTVLFIFIIGITFTLFAQTRNIIRLTRLKLIEFEREASKKKARKPKVLGGNLDLFLVTSGTLGIFISLVLIQSLLGLHGEGLNPELFNTFLPILGFLIVLSPIFFLLGFLLALNRTIPLVLHHTGNYFWKKNWGLLATAIRNLSVNRRVTVRTTFLIACTISFLMILSSLPISFAQYLIDNEYYTIGGEIRINPYDLDPELLPNLTLHLQAIPGLNITRISILRDYLTDFDSGFVMLGIEKNFPQVAFWPKWLDYGSFIGLVNMLYSSSSSYPVIIDRASARREDINVNDNFIYGDEDEPSYQFDFSVEAITDYWPGFHYYLSEVDIGIITKREIVQNISISLNKTHFKDVFLGKILPKFDERTVINQMKEVVEGFGISRYDVDVTIDRINNFEESFESRFLWILINFDFIGCLAVILSFIILYTFLRISTLATEIGLSRALGMKTQQVLFLMLLEPILLFLISGIPGAFAGIFILLATINLLQPVMIYSPLPFILNFNIPALIFVFGTIIIVTFLSGLISSIIATRTNVSKILKVE